MMADEKLTIAHQVFEIPELLEVILDYALYDDDNKLCSKNLVNIRNVAKSWNKAAKQVLQKNKEPLYKVRMTAANSLLQGRPRFKKTLETFTEFFGTREEKDAYFALEMEEDVFRLENQEQLQAFLEKLSHLLVELKIKVPENGGSLHGLFLNTMGLPELQKLDIDMCGDALEDLSAAETRTVSPGNSTWLLFALINDRRHALKELSLKGYIPTEFEFIQLPESLTKLCLTCVEENQETVFRCLVRNPLPNLRDLKLNHRLPEKVPPQVAQELLYNVFQHLGKSLQSLDLHELCEVNDYRGLRRPVLNLRFPVMRKLEQLDIWGIHSELNTRILSISTVFPRLESLTLWSHTEQMLSKWIANWPVPLVTKLELEMAQEENGDTALIPVETMNNVHLTYPNVTDLCLAHCGTQFDVLKYVFKEMRQLRRLTLEVMDTDEVETSHHWDSLLIGETPEIVEELARTSPQLRSRVQLQHSNEPSIRMLSELKFLWLDAHLVEDQGSMISDLSFIHALNGMSKLEHVKLRGRFQVSSEIVKEWEKQCRKVDYQEE